MISEPGANGAALNQALINRPKEGHRRPAGKIGRRTARTRSGRKEFWQLKNRMANELFFFIQHRHRVGRLAAAQVWRVRWRGSKAPIHRGRVDPAFF